MLLSGANCFAHNSQSCVDALVVSPASPVSASQLRYFLLNVVKPVIKSEFKWRELAPGQIEILIPDQPSIRVAWSSRPDLTEPEIQYEGERLLSIPTGFKWRELKPEQRKGLIKRLLVGHAAHPQAKVTGKKVLRPAQKEAVKSIVWSLEERRRSFLFVSPTGTGKTEILKVSLDRFLQITKQKVHFVVADSNFLVTQLVQEIQSIKGLSVDLRIWGDGKPAELQKALDDAKKNGPKGLPILVVTTIQSLRDAFFSLSPDQQNDFFLRVGYFGYDEVHHAGAHYAKQIVSGLIHSRGEDRFVYGTSATPIHRQTSIVNLFEDNVFWAYVDTAASFSKPGRTVDYSFQIIVDQLNQALAQGDLSPIGFIQLLTLNRGFDDLFVSTRSLGLDFDRYILAPEKMDVVAAKVMRHAKQHKFGFTSVSTQAEAEALFRTLSSRNEDANFRFAVLHSGLPPKEQISIRQDLRSGKINHLVTVKQLDEGIDVPGLSLYIDLNRYVGPRQFLQRLGRILRLTNDKTVVSVLTAMKIDESTVREALQVFQALQGSSLVTQQARQKSDLDLYGEGLRGSGLDDIVAELLKFRTSSDGFSEENVIRQYEEFVATSKRFPRAVKGPEGSLRRLVQNWWGRNGEDFYEKLSRQAKEELLRTVLKSVLQSTGASDYRVNALRLNQLFINVEFLSRELVHFHHLWKWPSYFIKSSFYYREMVSRLQSGLRLSAIHDVYGHQQHFLELLEEPARAWATELANQNKSYDGRDYRGLAVALDDRLRTAGEDPDKIVRSALAEVGLLNLTQLLYFLSKDAQKLLVDHLKKGALKIVGSEGDHLKTYKDYDRWFHRYRLLSARDPGLKPQEAVSKDLIRRLNMAFDEGFFESEEFEKEARYLKPKSPQMVILDGFLNMQP